MGQGLASSSRIGRCLARGSEVGELVASLLCVVLDILGNRSYDAQSDGVCRKEARALITRYWAETYHW